jgi:hypothetical protein
MILPPALKKKILGFDFGDIAANQAFYGHGLGKYSNAIQKGRGYAWYNPEGKLLRYLRSIVRDPKNISIARNKLWGVSYHDAMGAMESFV